METSLDLSRWSERPRGVGYRRWTMVTTGLRQLFRTKLFKFLLATAWSGGLLLAALGFLFSQSISSGGWLETLAHNFGPRAEAVVAAIAAFVLLYPEICIGGWYTLLFWLQSFMGLGLSLVALTAMIPRLITRDRSTHALTVYLSRPLTSGDYLLGKLGIIFGVLIALWTGPLLLGWVVSVAFAPDLDFVVHSFNPLLRGLLFHGVSAVALAAIALGVSAISRTPRNTTIIWIGLWLVIGAVAKPPGAPAWVRRASFTHSLGEARQGIIPLDTALKDAATILPIMNQPLVQNLSRASTKVAATDFPGALASLGVFTVLASFVFFRRLRPE